MTEPERPANVSELSKEARARLEDRLVSRRRANGQSLDRRTEEGPPPLSFAQERLWLLDQLYPETLAYNVTRLLRVPSAIDAGALRRALQRLVERHEVLRTLIAGDTEGPRAHVLEEFEVELELLHLEGVPSADLEEHGHSAVLEFARRPFDLARDVLLRALLVRFRADDHLLALVTHHIASDEGSRGLLVGELDGLYRTELGAEREPLAAMPIQYADYAAWQRERMTGPALERDLEYWRAQLAGSPSEIELPTDRPRPARATFRGARVSRLLSSDLFARAQELGREEGVTRFMVLFAGFVALLHRYSGQDEIVVGTPITARNRPELEGVIGLFLNNLVLRVPVEGACCFRELLARVKQSAVAAFAHQELPFEKVVEGLQPDRDLARSPLFNVTFTLEASATDETRFGGVPVRISGVDIGTTKYDLSLDMAERREGLQAVLEYSRDLFDEATASRLLGHLETLFANALAAPGTSISKLDILPEDERRLLLVEWNHTEAPYPSRCLHELLSERARTSAEKVAVRTEDGSLTYSELEERSNRLARRLLALGVGRDMLVGVCLERRMELLVALLAIWKAGGAYVPLDPSYPRERLTHMLEDARTPVLVTEAGLVGRLPATEVDLVLIDRDAEALARENASPLDYADHDPEQLAYVIYTSGSTGQPKGVEIPHRALVNFLFSVRAEPGFGADDVLLAVTTLSFDIAGLELYLPLLCGGTVVLCPTQVQHDPKALADLIERSGATVMQATPTTWQLLVESGWPGSPRLKCLCGGEALPQALAEELLRRGLKLWNMYGPTETTIWSTCARLEPGEPLTLGRPLLNTSLYVLDERLSPQPLGVPGELYIGGDGLARGYRNLPELTRERFVPDPFSAIPGTRLYRTGDLVRYRTDGRLEFLGRLDHQVKVRGFRVELGEIEAHLARHPGVAGCVCAAREDRPGDARLVAYVVPAGAPVSSAEMRRYLSELLPAYMIPSAIVSLSEFPLMPNGKIDRTQLPAPTSERGSGDEYVAPRTPTEELLVGLWAETLGVRRVGVRDDFFLLGGHSLLAARVTARVRVALGVEVPMAALFESPTVEGLAWEVERARQECAAAPPIAPVPRDGPLPASFAQHRVWYLDRLGPNTPTYNIPLVLRIRSEVNPDALERALNELLSRHEVLRTSFVEKDGQPFLTVAPDASIALERVDVRQARDPERAAIDTLVEAARSRFDLAQAPLVRACLARIAANEALLGLTLHHAVADGWSLRILHRELAALYEAQREGRNALLPELPVQYPDFAVWQRARIADDSLDAQRGYWTEQLAGAPALLELPSDRPRPASQSYRGARHVVTLAPTIYERLAAFARDEGATPFIVLLAAFKTLLCRYTGQTDVVIGTPIAGRSHVELENLIGFFANTLVLRTDLSGEPSFSELVARVRETALGAYAHQDVPFEELVAELDPVRSLSYTPLFQVMFILQNADEAGGAGDAIFTPLATDIGTARFDLTLSVTERREGLRMSFEYSTDLFDATTIERMAGHLGLLLEAAVVQAKTPISRLPLLTKHERRDLAAASTGPVAKLPREEVVHRLFEAQAAASPHRIAVVFEGESLTYAELESRANRLAARLRQLGVGPGCLVGLWVERHLNLMVGALAVLKAGGAYVPLEPSYPAERIAFMLDDAGIEVLVVPGDSALLPPHGANVVSLAGEAAELAALPDRPPDDGASATDLAYVIYTSGSTGVPKGVEITHRSLVNLLASMAKRPGLGSDDVLAAITTPAFDLSVPDLYLPLVRGATMMLAPAEVAADPSLLAELLSEHGVTVMQATPTTWRMLVDAGWSGGPGFRAICGGEAFPLDLAGDLLERVGSLWHMYGPTEATVWSTAQEVPPAGGLSIDPPIDNTTLYVLDDNLALVPLGVVGELCIGGFGLARGYRGRDELTRERFVPDPFDQRPGARLYRTGDLARRRTDGMVEFLGRRDSQVKLRGFRIELGEIESVLAAHPTVRSAVAVVREDRPGDPRLAAYVVPERQLDPQPVELRRHLEKSLPSYMVPSDLVTIGSLPLTPNGKLDRSALPAPRDGRREMEFVPPHTPIEEAIARIFTDLLGLECVGVNDDFFALGGHSFRATQLVSRIRDALRTEIPLLAVYETPTVGGLAEAVAVRLLAEEEALSMLNALDEEAGRAGASPDLLV